MKLNLFLVADRVKSMPDLSRGVICGIAISLFRQAEKNTNLFTATRILLTNIAVKL
jgi:hypothetical protein